MVKGFVSVISVTKDLPSAMAQPRNTSKMTCNNIPSRSGSFQGFALVCGPLAVNSDTCHFIVVKYFDKKALISIEKNTDDLNKLT